MYWLVERERLHGEEWGKEKKVEEEAYIDELKEENRRVERLHGKGGGGGGGEDELKKEDRLVKNEQW